ncbi:MAG: tetratricopeptide repeat protein, partial [Treponema sp.]|nr:tetratricopeptide repeat protein [Treponema sp.]
MNLKKLFIKNLFFLTFIALLLSCVTTGEGSGISLQDAIEQSAEKISADIPANSIVAVVAFESNNASLSDYIITELIGALVVHKVTVVTRQSLEFVQQELNFQMSGAVSDETAQSIGKFFGANMLVVGKLQDVGRSYRYNISTITVEEARHGSSVRLDVRNDRETQRMIRTFRSQHSPVENKITEQRIPTTPLDFLELGITLAMRGEYELAIMNFTDAITLNPNLVGAYMLRGRALAASVSVVFAIEGNFDQISTVIGSREVTAEMQKIYDLALEDYNQAIKLSPNLFKAYLDRGSVFINKGDYDSAIADLNQAIRLDPNNALGYTYRGFAYNRKSDYDRAIADYNQAIRLDPNYTSAYHNRGFLHHSKGDYDRAIADYNQAIKIDPNYTLAYGNRGYAYYDKGDYNRAIADYNRAIKLDPNMGVVFNNRGLAYNDKGDYDRA